MALQVFMLYSTPLVITKGTRTSSAACVTSSPTGIPEYIVEGKETNPVLPKQQGGKQPERWIHIKLSAKKGGKESTTTLVIRDDNLYVKGFTGKDGKWFELCEDREPAGEKLPPEYKATKLWGCK